MYRVTVEVWLGSPGEVRPCKELSCSGTTWRGSLVMVWASGAWLLVSSLVLAWNGSLGPFDLGTSIPVISSRGRVWQGRYGVESPGGSSLGKARRGESRQSWRGVARRAQARHGFVVLGETRQGPMKARPLRRDVSKQGEITARPSWNGPTRLGPSSLGGARRFPGKAV